MRGKRFKNVPPYRLVGEGLARSWQDVRIFKEMTVLDNVLVAGQNQSGENLPCCSPLPGGSKRRRRRNLARSLKMLELVGLLDKADHLASSLSNAEQKLVAIARLLATECPILLLDEPTAALDLDSVDKIIQLINRIARESGKTIPPGGAQPGRGQGPGRERLLHERGQDPGSRHPGPAHGRPQIDRGLFRQRLKRPWTKVRPCFSM